MDILHLVDKEHTFPLAQYCTRLLVMWFDGELLICQSVVFYKYSS